MENSGKDKCREGNLGLASAARFVWQVRFDAMLERDAIPKSSLTLTCFASDK